MPQTRKVQCPFQDCHHIWDTKVKTRYATCPGCTRKFLLEPNIIKVEYEDLEHFNLDEKGVKILDRSLGTPNSPNGRIIDVFFKPTGAWCGLDESASCRHVKFALSLLAVNQILERKGWKPR